MRRPVAVLVVTATVMLTLAIPAFGLHVTSGDNRNTPPGTEAADGLLLLESRIGPGPLAPHQVVVDTGPPGRGHVGRHGRRRAASPGAAAGGSAHRGRHHPGARRPLLPRRQARQPDRSRRRRAADPRRRPHRRGHRNRRRPRAQDPRHLHPARRLPRRRSRLPHRRPCLRAGLRQQGLRGVPVAAAGGARDHLLRAAARLPLGRAADQGRADEPALDHRLIRGAGARLPARVG